MTGAELVERALAALPAGAGGVAIATESSAVNLRYAANTLTTNGSVRDRSLTVIVVLGRQVGVRATSLLRDPADVGELVARAAAAAREAEPVQDHAELIAGDAQAGFDAGAERTGSAVFTGFAADLAALFDEARGQSVGIYGYAAHQLTTTWLGTSTGLRRRHVQPAGTVEWNAKNGQPGGSVWQGQATRDFTGLDLAGVWESLRRRLSWGRRQLTLPPGRYETLLAPAAAADLMLYAYFTAAGRDAADGRTVFSRSGGGTRVGERLGPPGLRLASDPAYPGLSTAPFVVAPASSSLVSVFDNGLPIAATDWISDGRLARLVTPRAVAGSDTGPAAPFADNLILDTGAEADLAALVAGTSYGLLTTCLWYIREVDPQTLLLTGLTRDGVFLVDGGEVVAGVNNFRFNESPVDLLGRFTESGLAEPTLSREWGEDFPWTVMPPLRVPDFHFSSVSPAS